MKPVIGGWTPFVPVTFLEEGEERVKILIEELPEDLQPIAQRIFSNYEQEMRKIRYEIGLTPNQSPLVVSLQEVSNGVNFKIVVFLKTPSVASSQHLFLVKGYVNSQLEISISSKKGIAKLGRGSDTIKKEDIWQCYSVARMAEKDTSMNITYRKVFTQEISPKLGVGMGHFALMVATRNPESKKEYKYLCLSQIVTPLAPQSLTIIKASNDGSGVTPSGEIEEVVDLSAY